ncbi:MAG: proteasome subunit beta [Crenarchaeota archaeon]|nr:proteasome subunit beta [Thermoproteota archaeon]
MFTRLPLDPYSQILNREEIVRKLETLKTGTTTVGIVTREGVVLATDKRATAGYFIANKNVKKIWKIDNHVAATMCGSVADVQRLLDELTRVAHARKIETGKPISLKSLASYASLVLFSSRPFILVVHIIIGGYDPDEGPILYALDWFGTVTRETKYTSTGSGSPIAFGVLEDGYREDMTIQDALRLAVRAVYAAMMRDPGSGEGIVAVTITKEGYREVPEEDIRRMLKSGQA